MNQQIKTEWLAELESGKWTCGTGWLETRPYTPGSTSTYSALGVLCEMYLRAGHQLYRQNTHCEYTAGQFVTAFDGETLALPAAVAQWAEMGVLPWMKLDKPSGIHNLAYICQLGGFALAITAIQEHL